MCLLTVLPVLTGRGQQGLSTVPQTDRHWNGLNPFEAPSQTTDYYGSGDIDLDGNITPKDLDLVREMIAGTRPPNVRADVDGNGVIDSADLALLEAALKGGTLPGWWNSLAGPGARTDWLRRVVAIDFNQLIQNQEADSDWGCDDFATRCLLRFTPQLLDPSNPLYERYGVAQNTFNLPVYVATVTAPGFGHTLNASLIGDDPTVFTNWFFLEPETGAQAQPGDWDLPWGAEAHIQQPEGLNAPYQSVVSLVSFQLAQLKVLTLTNDPDLLLKRPVPGSEPVHNNPNIWHPVLLPEGNGMVLFNKDRDDLLRSMNVHLSASPGGDPNGALALLPPGGFNRLVATAQASPGRYHLLWVCHTNRQPQLMYGQLATQTGLLSDTWVVATNVLEACLLSINTNEAFVFYPTEDGLTCVHKQGTQWEPAETVLQWTTLPFKTGTPCFAVTRDPNGKARVIWADETTQDGPYQTTIFEARRDQGWQTPQTVGVVDGFISTLGVAQDSTGTIHLVYANTWYPAFDCYSECMPEELWQVVRGTIRYRKGGQTGWSQPQTVATNSFWPVITVTKSDEVILAWETDQGDGVVPVWTDYTTGSTPQAFTTEGTPYYPAITETATGSRFVARSEVSQWGATFNYRMVRQPETITLSIATDPGGLRFSWRSRTGGTFQVEYASAMGGALWQPLGPRIVTESNYGSMIVPVDSTCRFRCYRVTKL